MYLFKGCQRLSSWSSEDTLLHRKPHSELLQPDKDQHEIDFGSCHCINRWHMLNLDDTTKLLTQAFWGQTLSMLINEKVLDVPAR